MPNLEPSLVQQRRVQQAAGRFGSSARSTRLPKQLTTTLRRLRLPSPTRPHPLLQRRALQWPPPLLAAQRVTKRSGRAFFFALVRFLTTGMGSVGRGAKRGAIESGSSGRARAGISIRTCRLLSRQQLLVLL